MWDQWLKLKYNGVGMCWVEWLTSPLLLEPNKISSRSWCKGATGMIDHPRQTPPPTHPPNPGRNHQRPAVSGRNDLQWSWERSLVMDEAFLRGQRKKSIDHTGYWHRPQRLNSMVPYVFIIIKWGYLTLEWCGSSCPLGGTSRPPQGSSPTIAGHIVKWYANGCDPWFRGAIPTSERLLSWTEPT